MRLPVTTRLAAFLVASVGLAGLALQFTVSLEKSGSAQAALWAMLRFFTIIGNSLTALVLLSAALGLGWSSRPAVLGGAALIMGLIGVVYATMLSGIEHLTGNAQTANLLLHYAVPALTALLWLLLVPKGGLTRIDPLAWALVPLAYFPYAILRGRLDDKYPYPFMDVGKLGWGQVLFNAAVIALGFLIVGLLMVWLDGKLKRGPAPAAAP